MESDLARIPAALEAERLSKVYVDGTRALDELSLQIPAGSFFGLLGPNGAGKTTLIGAVSGLVRIPSVLQRTYISERKSSCSRERLAEPGGHGELACEVRPFPSHGRGACRGHVYASSV